MLKYYNYDIVCQEIPDEVTLAINISGCPNHCPGCHSPWLWEDVGRELDEDTIRALIKSYGTAITCVCFMGGDSEPKSVEHLASVIKSEYPIKTAWYSGREILDSQINIHSFDFVKVGPYIESLGGLKSPTTNQRFYRILPNGIMYPMFFWK